jgi:hypothetical protein
VRDLIVRVVFDGTLLAEKHFLLLRMFLQFGILWFLTKIHGEGWFFGFIELSVVEFLSIVLKIGFVKISVEGGHLTFVQLFVQILYHCIIGFTLIVGLDQSQTLLDFCLLILVLNLKLFDQDVLLIRSAGHWVKKKLWFSCFFMSSAVSAYF